MPVVRPIIVPIFIFSYVKDGTHENAATPMLTVWQEILSAKYFAMCYKNLSVECSLRGPTQERNMRVPTYERSHSSVQSVIRAS